MNLILEKNAKTENGFFEDQSQGSLISLRVKRTNNLLIFAISAPIPVHIHITSAFSVALLFPFFIMSGKITLLCNIISGCFNETLWNLLLLLIRKDKQWNIGLIETNRVFLLISVEPELDVWTDTDTLDPLSALTYLWVKEHWLCCRS